MKCSYCDNNASHILVNYHHDIVGDNEVFCREHAFEEERQQCRHCDGYKIVTDESGNEIKLSYTYAPGELDEKGCCCEHP